jgi:predicted RNA-binding Zn ribbon-like protein
MELDSYIDAGVFAAVSLANDLSENSRSDGKYDLELALNAIRRALAIDPPSVASLKITDVPDFVALARQLRKVFECLDAAKIDEAAEILNRILSDYPAAPHLAKENGLWRLHHHSANAAVVAMWSSICAEGVARMIGAQAAQRLAICAASDCDRAFVDLTKNASRKFCSTTCQNRTKTAAFRVRQKRLVSSRIANRQG